MKVILLESDIKKNMIIVCVNCNKKFNVNSELIPADGRKIQCGSCNHTWQYQIKKEITKSQVIVKNKILEKYKPSAIIKEETYVDIDAKNKNKDKNKTIGFFFSNLLVLIITFIALLILIDTLKSPLINLFPQLEIFLFNLFETLKDIKLFIIDLT